MEEMVLGTDHAVTWTGAEELVVIGVGLMVFGEIDELCSLCGE
jgi:hypothetical protein